KVVEEQLHLLGMIDKVLGTVALSGPAFFEMAANFAGKARFVEIEDPGQEACSPNSTEAAVWIEQADGGARPGGGDGGRNTRRTSPANDDIRVFMQRDFTRWFEEMSSFRRLSFSRSGMTGLRQRRGERRASEGGGEELSAGRHKSGLAMECYK